MLSRRFNFYEACFLEKKYCPFQVLLQPHDPVILSGSVPNSNDPVPIGATVEQIKRFSTTYKYIKESTIPENEQERCTVYLYFLSSICQCICYQSLPEPFQKIFKVCLNDFETNEDVRALRCNHVFHVVCIDRWLVYNKKCPVCRLDLDKTNVMSVVSV